MKRSTLLLSLLSAIFRTAYAEDVNFLFTGQAHISVLNFTTSYELTTPNNSIGCLNARGALTLNDCAVFTKTEFAAPLWTQQIVTARGPCSFRDNTTVTNAKSAYGWNDHALSCAEGYEREGFYTVVSACFHWMRLILGGWLIRLRGSVRMDSSIRSSARATSAACMRQRGCRRRISMSFQFGSIIGAVRRWTVRQGS
jgi:hypothetical protein